jgi:lysozyme
VRTHQALALLLCSIPLAACGAPDGLEDGPFDTSEQAIKVCPGPVTVEGIDVASYQPNTNWPQVKASGRVFAIVKATEATGYVNPYFKQDWAGIKDVGMLRGAYHYFHADTDPIAQANHFLTTMGPLDEDDLPGVLDLEEAMGQSKAVIAQRALAWLEHVEKATGKTPILYTGPSFWDTSVAAPGFTKYPLWIANYGVMCPTVPGEWKTFQFWQYTSTGPVPGVQNPNVDKNVFNGSFEDLMAFATGGSRRIAQQSGNGTISVVNWPDTKHAEVFVTSNGGDLLHTWSEGATDNWNPLATLDSGAKCGFEAAFWPSPKSVPEVFSPTEGGGSQHLFFDAAAGWTKFEDFGGSGLSRHTTLTWPDGHLEVFALGADKAIWHKTWDLGAGAWSDWSNMGGTFATGVSAIVWGDGHAELLATDIDGTPYLNFSGDFPSGWYGWLKLEGSLSSRPVTVRWPDGHIEAFARGLDGQLQHSHYSSAINKWIPFTVLSEGTKIEGEPSVIMNIEGNGIVAGPEVFARGADGKALHLWWDGSAYTNLEPLLDQVVGSDPFGWTRADGRAEVFAIDTKGELVKTYRGDAGWTAWASLGGGDLNTCLPGSGSGGEGGAGGSGGSSGTAGGGQGGNGIGGEGTAAGSCSCRAVGASIDAPSENLPFGIPGAGWLAAALAPLVALRRNRRR